MADKNDSERLKDQINLISEDRGVLMTDLQTDRQTFAIVELLSRLKRCVDFALMEKNRCE